MDLIVQNTMDSLSLFLISCGFLDFGHIYYLGIWNNAIVAGYLRAASLKGGSQEEMGETNRNVNLTLENFGKPQELPSGTPQKETNHGKNCRKRFFPGWKWQFWSIYVEFGAEPVWFHWGLVTCLMRFPHCFQWICAWVQLGLFMDRKHGELTPASSYNYDHMSYNI